MKKKQASLPSIKTSTTIRLLWHSIYSLAEIATDLEDAAQSLVLLKPKKLSTKQKNLLAFIGDLNDKVTHFSEDSFTLVYTQQRWLEFLTDLIRSTRKKVIPEKKAKSILMNKCKEYFQSDEEDYKEIEKKSEKNQLKINEIYNNAPQLEVMIIQNELKAIRKTLEQLFKNEERQLINPKQIRFVHESFKNLSLNTFVENAWKEGNKKEKVKKSISKNKTIQGPVEDAKAMLNKILTNSSPTTTRDILKENYTKLHPVYFHNEDFIDKSIVLLRAAEELGIPLTADSKKYLTDQIKPRSYFDRPDVPQLVKLKKHKENHDASRTPDGWS